MTDGTEGRIIASLKGERKGGNADLIRGEHKKRGGSTSMKKVEPKKWNLLQRCDLSFYHNRIVFF